MNKSLILLIVTWMLVIPSLIVWDANAAGELPESSKVVCEAPPVQVIKLAPFTCKTVGATRYSDSKMMVNCE